MAGMPVITVLFLLILAARPCAEAQKTFIFPILSRLSPQNLSSLDLLGNAVEDPNLGISITNQSEYSTGSVYYSEPVRMKNGTLSFSTTFVFAMIPSPQHSLNGDGLVFIITPTKSREGGLPGSYLGLFNLTSMGRPENHLFAVEFDSVKNQEFEDIDDNHVGVDLNSLHSTEAESAGYWVGDQLRELDLNGGLNIQAWIDYDHLENQIEVTIAPAGSLRPTKPLISRKNINLSTILEENMYVGFVASTGVFVQQHYILAWSFSTNGTAPALNTTILPFFIKTKIKSKTPKWQLITGITTGLVLLAVAAAALMWFKRSKYTEIIEEWEIEYWPHRFRYRDLHIATKGFGEEQVIGRGGFGVVYRGVLPANGLEVAIKCIFRETSEGVKEFIAEISSLGRLQHRNLVLIKGYCRRGKKLFIVYDYMPNGSLDKMIFGNPLRVLGWAQRYKILRDVAAGLLYLHQGWEQRVVHRDIKSCNVLLDSELNGKLGDFGLARLYGHDESSLTTRVAGTPGYIAPELVHTGRATPSTDVFSFGVLMLEVACGRRPIETNLDAAQEVLLDWVRELNANDTLLHAADAKLGGDYVQDEMERVLRLGLLCSNPRREMRPGMRQVVQILEGKASITATPLQLSFQMSTPSVSWMSTPNLSWMSSTDASTSKSLEGFQGSKRAQGKTEGKTELSQRYL